MKKLQHPVEHKKNGCMEKNRKHFTCKSASPAQHNLSHRLILLATICPCEWKKEQKVPSRLCHWRSQQPSPSLQTHTAFATQNDCISQHWTPPGPEPLNSPHNPIASTLLSASALIPTCRKRSSPTAANPQIWKRWLLLHMCNISLQGKQKSGKHDTTRKQQPQWISSN